jgi:hypothetical protein
VGLQGALLFSQNASLGPKLTKKVPYSLLRQAAAFPLISRLAVLLNTNVDYVNTVRKIHVKHVIKLSLDCSALGWLTRQSRLEDVEAEALSVPASLRLVSVASIDLYSSPVHPFSYCLPVSVLSVSTRHVSSLAQRLSSKTLCLVSLNCPSQISLDLIATMIMLIM